MSTTALKEVAPAQDTAPRVSSPKPPRNSMRRARRTPAPSLTHFLALPLVTPHSRPQLQSSLDAFRCAAKTDSSLQIPEPVALHAIRPLDTLHLTICVLNLPEREPDLLQNAIECLNELDLEGLWREAQVKAEEDKERVMLEEAQLGALESISNGEIPESGPSDIEELKEILKAEKMEKDKRKESEKENEKNEQEQSHPDQLTSLNQREPTPEDDHSDTEIIMKRETEFIMERERKTFMQMGTKMTLERETDIIVETQTLIEERTRPEPSPEVQPVRVTLKGLTAMRNPERTSVLYAPPLDPTGALQRFCNSIRDAFIPFMPSPRPPPSPSPNSRPSTPSQPSNQNQSADTSTPPNAISTTSNTPSTPSPPDQIQPPTTLTTPIPPPPRRRPRRPKPLQPVLLHATILNTVYLPNRSRSERRVEIDARPALDRFKDTLWMRDVRVEKLALLRMGAREEVDAQGNGTGVVRYVVEAERGMP